MHGVLRAVAAGCHFMIFICAVINTGLLSYMIRNSVYRTTHLIYQEVVAVVTLVLFFGAIFLPMFKRYRGFFLPVDFIFSYLWLTSFIFSIEDWTGGRCAWSVPRATWQCSRRHTIEAFNFIVFFFLLCNIVVEGLLLGRYRKEPEIKNGARNGSDMHGPTSAAA
ncbi:hypothetical protein HIM_07851 [Hirsutella minnesotensis 3608]|uniref:MARVEL domain-containing protein n=1 Tax=Hirsutella minnesotensis 3608 TaxID=1043627 RepID=A0A0F7ZHK0_9HYPO|nr:hypothetical protein HIM_07851 [Hirsutella minnesotensis 3608]